VVPVGLGLDGTALDDNTTRRLRHEPFVDAASALFRADVVRPMSLIVNLMGPMAAGGPHVDTPSFRGLMRSEVPVWLALPSPTKPGAPASTRRTDRVRIATDAYG
jgi:hypothetical protein